MGPNERTALVRGYAEGHAAIMAAFQGLSGASLDRAPPGEWSARQISHHLADTEVFRAARLRRLLSQDAPIIQAFDEGRLVQRLYYGRPHALSLELFDVATRSNLELLASLQEADWARVGTHTELGRWGMDTWLERAAEHVTEHAAQLGKVISN